MRGVPRRRTARPHALHAALEKLRRQPRACTAGSTRSGRTATSAAATASRSTPTSSSCSSDAPGSSQVAARGRADHRRRSRYKRQLDAEEHPAARRAARRSRCRWSRTSSCSPTTRIPGAVQDTVRAPYTDELAGAVDRAAHRRVPPGQRVPAGRARPGRRAARARRPRRRAAGGHEAGGSPRRPTTPSGHLTTKARAEWAADRQAPARAGPGQRRRRSTTIETALFCVCLEDAVPRDDLGRPATSCCTATARNRWFDKAVSFVVFADGTAGINVEHCGLDGTTILGFVDAAARRRRPRSTLRVAGAAAQGVPAPRRSSFVLDDALRDDVREAAGVVRRLRRGHRHHRRCPFADFGADRAKAAAASRRTPSSRWPTSWPTGGRRASTGATYESIATRQYRHGRTEAMRVVTPEVLRFVDRDGRPGRRRRRRAGRRSGPRPRRTCARAKECQAGRGARAAPVGAAADPAAGAAPSSASPSRWRCTDSPGWLIMRDDYLSTSSAPSVEHPVLRLRVDQRHVHRRRLRAAARPAQPLPEHARGPSRPA